MGHDMQGNNWDIAPTWEQWRRGFDSMPEILSARFDTSAFPRCARFSNPSPTQFDGTLDDELTYKHMLNADHIYFLCVQCDQRKFPLSWTGKISMLDGIELDTCLKQDARQAMRATMMAMRATMMHKLVIWAAKEQHHRTIMVLEEDFTLPEPSHRNPNLNHTALDEFINSGSWDFLRFGHMPIPAYVQRDDHCLEECFCVRESLSMDVCTPPIGCDIRSSVAYMVAIRGSIVDDILNAPGIIDYFILQDLKQSYIVPGMIHQRKQYYAMEVANERVFMEHCLRG
jgi:hypothetical protein